MILFALNLDAASSDAVRVFWLEGETPPPVNATASGSLAAISLAAPNASAAGTANAVGVGSLAAISLAAPQATAAGGFSGLASGSLAAIQLQPPQASAGTSADAFATGEVAGIYITAPSATAEGTDVGPAQLAPPSRTRIVPARPRLVTVQAADTTRTVPARTRWRTVPTQ